VSLPFSSARSGRSATRCAIAGQRSVRRPALISGPTVSRAPRRHLRNCKDRVAFERRGADRAAAAPCEIARAPRTRPIASSLRTLYLQTNWLRNISRKRTQSKGRFWAVRGRCAGGFEAWLPERSIVLVPVSDFESGWRAGTVAFADLAIGGGFPRSPPFQIVNEGKVPARDRAIALPPCLTPFALTTRRPLLLSRFSRARTMPHSSANRSRDRPASPFRLVWHFRVPARAGSFLISLTRPNDGDPRRAAGECD